MSDAKKAKLADQFDQLSSLTTLVADTGDVDAIKKYVVAICSPLILRLRRLAPLQQPEQLRVPSDSSCVDSAVTRSGGDSQFTLRLPPTGTAHRMPRPTRRSSTKPPPCRSTRPLWKMQ